MRNLLLVEGKDDLYCIAELMGHYTPWCNDKRKAPVEIIDAGSVEELLNSKTLLARIKERGRENIGIIVDADSNFDGRWDSLRKSLKEHFPLFPEKMPSKGLTLASGDNKQKLGIWVMPDNQSSGMLETFLSYLVVDEEAKKLWQYAEEVAINAKVYGATYKDVHLDKSKIHTWLAWQDTPGDALGRAITKKTLNPKAPPAENFAEWFMELFDLPPISA